MIEEWSSYKIEGIILFLTPKSSKKMTFKSKFYYQTKFELQIIH